MFLVTARSAVGGDAESTATVRARVLTARATAADRWGEHGWRTNAKVPGPALRARSRWAEARFGRWRRPCAAVNSPHAGRPGTAGCQDAG